jgi:mannose-6-phosphate isomerase-like protein (cupin superfamily)
MSKQSGIPVSTLSKVEHGRLSLTYDRLLQLSQRLRLDASELFPEPGELEGGAILARRSLGLPDSALSVTSLYCDHIILCTEMRRKRMVPIITTVRAKTLGEADILSHSGEEYVYVLKGQLTVHSEFYDPVLLQAGQSMYIDAHMSNAYLAAEGCEEAVTLRVCSSAKHNMENAIMKLHGSKSPPPTGWELSPRIADRG